MTQKRKVTELERLVSEKLRRGISRDTIVWSLCHDGWKRAEVYDVVDKLYAHHMVDSFDGGSTVLNTFIEILSVYIRDFSFWFKALGVLAIVLVVSYLHFYKFIFTADSIIDSATSHFLQASSSVTGKLTTDMLVDWKTLRSSSTFGESFEDQVHWQPDDFTVLGLIDGEYFGEVLSGDVEIKYDSSFSESHLASLFFSLDQGTGELGFSRRNGNYSWDSDDVVFEGKTQQTVSQIFVDLMENKEVFLSSQVGRTWLVGKQVMRLPFDLSQNTYVFNNLYAEEVSIQNVRGVVLIRLADKRITRVVGGGDFSGRLVEGLELSRFSFDFEVE